MKRLHALPVLAFGIALLLSACQGNPLEPANCKRGTCIKLDMTRPGKLAEDSTLTVTIDSQVEEPETKVYFQFSAPDVLIDGQPSRIVGEPNWMVHLQPRQPQTVTTKIRFPREGYFLVVAHAYTRDGRDVFDGFDVRVTPGGITPNPTPEIGPGTPATAVKVDKTQTPKPRTPTLTPPPTRPPYP